MNMHTKKDIQNNTHTAHTHTEDTLALSVLEKIHEEKICPKNKGYFICRDITLWTPGIVVTIIGAFAWAGIIFHSTHSSLPYREFIGLPVAPFIVHALPTVWVIFFLVFALFVIKAFRQTKHGYKYSTTTVLGVSVVVSFVLGCIIVQSDVYYRNPLIRFPTEHIQKHIWFNPAEGRIVGFIQKTNHGGFVLIDKNKKTWILDTTEMPLNDELLARNTLIRLVGRAHNDTTFLVCMMVPSSKGYREEPVHMFTKSTDTFTECDSVLQKIREHHRERKFISASVVVYVGQRAISSLRYIMSLIYI